MATGNKNNDVMTEINAVSIFVFADYFDVVCIHCS